LPRRASSFPPCDGAPFELVVALRLFKHAGMFAAIVPFLAPYHRLAAPEQASDWSGRVGCDAAVIRAADFCGGCFGGF
jgi:hypothetical protein